MMASDTGASDGEAPLPMSDVPTSDDGGAGDMESITRKALVDWADEDGVSLLANAVMNGHVMAAGVMLLSGANANHRDNLNTSVLDIAVQSKNRALVALFLRFGSTVDPANGEAVEAVEALVGPALSDFQPPTDACDDDEVLGGDDGDEGCHGTSGNASSDSDVAVQQASGNGGNVDDGSNRSRRSSTATKGPSSSWTGTSSDGAGGGGTEALLSSPSPSPSASSKSGSASTRQMQRHGGGKSRVPRTRAGLRGKRSMTQMMDMDVEDDGSHATRAGSSSNGYHLRGSGRQPHYGQGYRGGRFDDHLSMHNSAMMMMGGAMSGAAEASVALLAGDEIPSKQTLAKLGNQRLRLEGTETELRQRLQGACLRGNVAEICDMVQIIHPPRWLEEVSRDNLVPLLTTERCPEETDKLRPPSSRDGRGGALSSMGGSKPGGSSHDLAPSHTTSMAGIVGASSRSSATQDGKPPLPPGDSKRGVQPITSASGVSSGSASTAKSGRAPFVASGGGKTSSQQSLSSFAYSSSSDDDDDDDYFGTDELYDGDNQHGAGRMDVGNQMEDRNAPQTISPAEVEQLIKEQVDELREFFDRFDSERAEGILRHFKWMLDLERIGDLMGEGYDEDKFCQVAGFRPPPSNDPGSVSASPTSYTLPGSDRTCCTCLRDLASSEFVGLGCQHTDFCRDCWRTYLDTKTSSQADCLSAKCIGHSKFDTCNLIVPRTFFELYASVPTVASYMKHREAEFVMNFPRRVLGYCPGADCQRICAMRPGTKVDDVVRSSLQVKCDCALKTFCFGCVKLKTSDKKKHAPHPPATCRNVHDWVKKTDAEGLFYTFRAKHCPNGDCQAMIVKCGCTGRIICNDKDHCPNQACNHMTCKKCNFHFCWICLGAWENHTSYYQCNKELSKKQTDAQFFKGCLERYDDHYSSYKKTLDRVDLSKELDDFFRGKDAIMSQVNYFTECNDEMMRCYQVLANSYIRRQL